MTYILGCKRSLNSNRTISIEDKIKAVHLVMVKRYSCRKVVKGLLAKYGVFSTTPPSMTITNFKKTIQLRLDKKCPDVIKKCRELDLLIEIDE
jgi:hypothetical protein